MKISLSFIATWLAVVSAQQSLECTREVARTDECADVINPNACYNQFRWSARTLSCIEGKDDADRKRKASLYRIFGFACMCCNCVGTAMCNWVNQNRYCSG
ncbi:hypothetical protein QBC35DRAFT_391960 [Podospora australis]|uniref:Uncharacterized protein n=1 Tax=Podospora australis TaxID=1536484 RepID=A0AAN6WM01_9PEZI|nr:hypothetical protein QBC35DRAFT_391960 [Podospora australis]